MSRRFALVRINNQKYSETYSEPILKASTLEEMQMKLEQKTAAPGIGGGLDDLGDWDDFEGLL